MMDLGALPLVAILRGVEPGEVVAIGEALVAEGFRIVEVPLNSPQPLDSIARLVKNLGNDVLIGAGTVRDPDDIARIANAGGRLIVMPHSDARVIAEAKRQHLFCLPGVATPTEAFAALASGADGLKMFPAEALLIFTTDGQVGVHDAPGAVTPPPRRRHLRRSRLRRGTGRAPRGLRPAAPPRRWCSAAPCALLPSFTRRS